MDGDARRQAEHVLRRIGRAEWSRLFDKTDVGDDLLRRRQAVRDALAAANLLPKGAPPRPTAEVVDLYGDRLLLDRDLGPWIRRRLIESLPSTKWSRMVEHYQTHRGARSGDFHGNMSQHGTGARVLADYWHHGGRWAHSFCEVTGLPPELARGRRAPVRHDEEIIPAEPLPPLHDFQLEVYASMRRTLGMGTGKAAMLSLPTGAGKTRVAVEAVCDHLAAKGASRTRNVVVWLATTNELLLQAWECFRQVWQVPPQRAGGAIRRTAPLALVRAWGGRDAEDLDLDEQPTVVIAGVDQLASWARNRPEVFDRIPRRRLACAVLDEAHGIITREYRDVLIALGLRISQREWRAPKDAPPIFGLSATPWRSRDQENRPLHRYFQRSLVTPASLGDKPIARLQKKKILARVDWERLRVRETEPMSSAQRRRFEQFKELPADYLGQIGLSGPRNAKILKRLARLPRKAQTLVFACSVEHAEVLTIALNRVFGAGAAAVVTGTTPRAERADVIERFRGGGLRFLCNVGVLTTGFDAPRADVVCMTRPTTSAVLYEQMVGRGLRGRNNGGTDRCRVIDVQDDGMPDGILSYGRVLDLWDQ